MPILKLKKKKFKGNNKYISEKLPETSNIYVKSEAFCPREVSCSKNMDWLRKSLSNDSKRWRNFTAHFHWQGQQCGDIGTAQPVSCGPFFQLCIFPFYKNINWRNKEQYSWLSGFSVQYPDLYIPNPLKIFLIKPH